MAVQRQFNYFSGIRFDIPFARSIESAVSADFDASWRGYATGINNPLLLRGFNLVIPQVAIPATALQINPSDSAILHASASESGTIFTVPANTPADTLNATNTNPGGFINVVGAFQNGVPNYVGLDLVRISDPTTVDITAGWSPAQNLEYQRLAPIGYTLQYVYIISSTGFGNTLPLYIIGVSNTGTFEYATKCTTNMFRLGSGGADPNPMNRYNWGGYDNIQPGANPRREWINTAATGTSNPLTVVPGADPNAFQFGDFNIGSQKEWNDAAMTRFCEITGSAYWYFNSATPGGGGGGSGPGGGGPSGGNGGNPPNLFDVWFDSSGSVLTGVGNISYNYVLESSALVIGAYQDQQTDRTMQPTDSYVLGVTSGTEADISFFNGTQLVINSVSNPSTTPFVYGETIYDVRTFRFNPAIESLVDIAPATDGTPDYGSRYGYFARTPATSAPQVSISSWSFDDKLITINTATAHGLNVGDQVNVQGLVLTGVTNPAPNNVFLVKDVPSVSQFVISSPFSIPSTATPTAPAAYAQLDRAFNATTYDYFRQPYLPRMAIQSWSYSGNAIALVIPNHSFHAPIAVSGSTVAITPPLDQANPQTITVTSTAGIRVGDQVQGPGFSDPNTVVESIVNSTTVTVNQIATSASGTYTFSSLMIVSGLTAATNAPNQRAAVTSVVGTTVNFLAAATPTGTAGIAMDVSSTFNVGYARYDRYAFLLTITEATPTAFNLTNTPAECQDDCQFSYLIGPNTIPAIGTATGAIVFNGVVAISTVLNPIQVQSITNDGLGNLTVTTYEPSGVITNPGPLTFTIYGSASESIYFTTYTNVSLTYISPTQFMINNTGIISGASYTNTNTSAPAAWSGATTYAYGAVVSYSGQYYQALQTTTGNTPSTSPTYWEITYLSGTDAVFLRYSNNPYPGPIQWSSDMIVKGVIGNKAFDIPKTATASGTPLANQFNTNGVTGTAYLQDGEVAYVVLQRNLSVSIAATYTTTGGNTVSGATPPLDVYGNPLQAGDFVKFSTESESYWYQIAGTPGTNIVSTSFNLVTNFNQPPTTVQRPNASGSLVYAKGYYPIVYVSPYWQVPATQDVMWIAVRQDNGGLASKMYLRDLQLTVGEVRQINAEPSLNLLQYTGAGNSAAINPNYSVIDTTGAYQLSQTLIINEIEETTWMVSFFSAPPLGFQVGDQIQYTVGPSTTSYSIKQVLDNLSVILQQNVSTIANITSISMASSGLITVTTDNPHNLSTGQTVIISGVAPDVFNGSYIVTVTSPTTFTYQQIVVFAATANSNNTITGVPSGDALALLKDNMAITDSASYVPASTVISSIPSSSTVMISQPATGSGADTFTATFTPASLGQSAPFNGTPNQGFVSTNNPLVLGAGQSVEYLQVNNVLQDSDNLTLGLRKEDRTVLSLQTVLNKPIYDENFFIQQINLVGQGLVASGQYVYTGPQNSPTFLAWVLHGNAQSVETIEGVNVAMPGGHPSIIPMNGGTTAILVAVISGSINNGTTLYQQGVATSQAVSDPGSPAVFASPTIAGGTSMDGVEIVLPPNRRTQVVGSAYVQWPSYLSYQASTGANAGSELFVIINDQPRTAGVDYIETFGGPKGKIQFIRSLPANTTIRSRLLSAYGSPSVSGSGGGGSVTLQGAYNASSINNYTIIELANFPVTLISGNQPTGGSALNILGSIVMNSTYGGNVVGGLFGSSDQAFDIGSEANKPRYVWAAEAFVKTHSNFTGSALETYTAAMTTTLSSATVITGSNFSVPINANPQAYRFKVYGTANRTDGTLGVAAFEMSGLFYSNASSAPMAGGSPESEIVGYSGDGINYALAFGISGQDVVIVAYGAAAPVNWAITVEVQAVIGST